MSKTSPAQFVRQVRQESNNDKHEVGRYFPEFPRTAGKEPTAEKKTQEIMFKWHCRQLSFVK